MLQKRFNLSGGLWWAEVIALCLVAALLAQELQLRGGFHALGGGLQAQGLGHTDDGADDGAVVAVVLQIAHERLVDLQLVELKMLELAQG